MKNKIGSYVRDVYDELVNKVTWPTWKELQSSALVVMAASLVIALVVFVMDFTFENIMGLIYKLLY